MINVRILDIYSAAEFEGGVISGKEVGLFCTWPFWLGK